jgi:glycosyltransferase involved in cell wall biosynthesis
VPGRSGFDDPSRGGEAPPPGAPALVVAFGILAPIRQPLRLLEGFASAQSLVPKAQLAFVGPAPPELAQQVLAHADRLGVGRRVTVTGEVRTSRYLEWMGSATVAAQLRGEWNGEASGSVAEALVAGLPVIASNIGWVRELPDSCVMKIDPRMTTEELGAGIAHLLLDQHSRAALREGAWAFAPKLSFANAAQALLDELFHAERAPGSGRC